MSGERQLERHTIEPVFDSQSRVLILGSFPSVKSREIGFFYGHPQNRFWRVLAAIFDDAVPQTTPERKAFLLRHHVAVWDVIASCEIVGSSDASIRNVTANDLSRILHAAPIRSVFVNGRTAQRLYEQYAQPLTGVEARRLPSTSPANAAWSLPSLIDAWRIVAEATFVPESKKTEKNS